MVPDDYVIYGFFVSLIACIPGTRLGYPAVVMALTSVWGTLRMHREIPRTMTGC